MHHPALAERPVEERSDHVPPTLDLGWIGDEHIDRYGCRDGATQACNQLVSSIPVHLWEHNQDVDVGIGAVLTSSHGAEKDHLDRVARRHEVGDDGRDPLDERPSVVTNPAVDYFNGH